MVSLACNDVDPTINCPFVAQGNTEEQVINDTAQHAKEVHGYTDEQLNDPDLMKKIKTVVKRE